MQLMLMSFVASFALNVLLEGLGVMQRLFFEQDALVYVPVELIPYEKPALVLKIESLVFEALKMPESNGTSNLMIALLVGSCAFLVFSCVSAIRKQKGRVIPKPLIANDPEDDSTCNRIESSDKPIDKASLSILNRPSLRPIRRDLQEFLANNPLPQPRPKFITVPKMPERNPHVFMHVFAGLKQKTQPTITNVPVKANFLGKLFFNGLSERIQSSFKV